MKTKPTISIDLEKVRECASLGFTNDEIAAALGISKSTFYNRQGESEEFRLAVRQGKAKAHIFVGGQLMKLIEKGNVTAIIFYLKARAGWRENGRQEAEYSTEAAGRRARENDVRKLSNEQLLEIARLNAEAD